MANSDIKLRRKKANSPNILSGSALTLTINYREFNFPLTDDNGDPLPSDKSDNNGGVLPQYYDFELSMAVPTPIPTGAAAKQAFVDDLKAQLDERAKAHAQQRANLILDQKKIGSIVKLINADTGLIFEGTYTIPGV